MSRIKTFQPSISVKLTKAIEYMNGTAARYSRVKNPIDLTPFLADSGAVTTHKDIRKPLGTFSIVFPDQMEPSSRDSLYALISPMDHIEIRMARNAWKFPGVNLPIVMRGFVTNIRREQRVGDDGKPNNVVIVQGQDYGKLVSMLQIFYEKNYGLGQNFLTKFKLSANHPISGLAYRADKFIGTVIDGIVNPELKKLWQASTLIGTIRTPLKLHVDASVTDGVVQPYSFQSYQGDLWGLMRGFADLYWNELFIEDREDGTYVVYRPLPFKDISGRFIGPGKNPGVTRIEPVDVKKIDATRSDVNMGNYFWVHAPRSEMSSPQILQMDAHSRSDDYFIKDHANADPTLYGIRKMEVNTEQGHTDETTSGANLPASQQGAAERRMYSWISERRKRLMEYNKDNVVFEGGSIDLIGNEAVRPGTYLNIDYGNHVAEHYVTAVTHNFVPFQGFTTEVSFTRGTDFVQRTKALSSSYLATRSTGVYG